MKNVKFWLIKNEIRAIGIDDSPFVSKARGQKVIIIGAILRGGQWVEGVLRGNITIDGNDATVELANMINKSKHKDQLRVILLNGITLGGFNIVNIKELFESTGIPVIVITRKHPEFNKIKKALENFNDKEARWKAICAAGRIYKVKSKASENPIYMQFIGLEKKDAEKIVQITSGRSIVPEPIRVAHLIASGVVKGESVGRA